MKENFKLILPHLFTSEGGIADRPKHEDSGGLTNMGITHRTLTCAHKRGIVPHDDPYKLTKEEATKIYRIQFWDAANCDRLPSGLDYAVFDFVVNSGQGRAVKELQKIIGAKPDGIVGLETLEAIQGYDTKALIKAYCDERLRFMRSLSNWKYNKSGWEKRVRHVQFISLELLRGDELSVSAHSDLATEAPTKAEGKKKVSVVSMKPEAVYGGISAVSGLMGAISDNPVLSWAAAIVLVAGAGVAGYYFYNRIQNE